MSRAISLVLAVFCLGVAVVVFVTISTKQSQNMEQAKRIASNAAARMRHLADRGEYSEGMDVFRQEDAKYNKAIEETKQRNAGLSVLSIVAVILISLGFRRPKNVEQQT